MAHDGRILATVQAARCVVQFDDLWTRLIGGRSRALCCRGISRGRRRRVALAGRGAADQPDRLRQQANRNHAMCIYLAS